MNKHLSIQSVLITGIGGAAGSYLAEFFAGSYPDFKVHGISRWHSASLDNLSEVSGRITVHEADLLDFGSVLSVLTEVRPDVIFHLASHANVRASFITPNAVMANNILGTGNLFEAVRLAKLNPIIQLGSTSEVYGQVDPKYIPIKEDTPLNPANPYAVSKTAQDLLGGTYFLSYKMQIIRTRAFGYINPRRPDLFATSFAKQIALIELGLKKELLHGNLESIRTMLDVRDISRAYWDAILYCQPGEIYNVGSTSPVSVKEVLEYLVSKSTAAIPTRTDENLLRPSDVTLQVPCVDKFVAATSWKPIYSLHESLEFLLQYWRREAKKQLKEIQDPKGDVKVEIS